MADYGAIAAAGRSIQRLLNLSFETDEPIENRRTRAVLIRTEDFDPANASTNIGSPAVSIWFYRVDFNKTMRGAWSGIGSLDGRGHLPVDLHFLISAWAENAEFELRILGKAVECMESNPVLGGPMLHPSANWSPNETVQVVMEDISTEAVMRTFDSLPADYRLSVPYVARVVRIDSRVAHPETPVTTLVTGKKPF